MLGTDRGASAPGALPREWILVLLMLALALAACGGTGGRATSGSSPAACAQPPHPGSCLRYVEGVARARSIKLTSRIPLEVRQSCAAAARLTRIRVICPPVIPAGGVVRIPGAEQLYGPQIVTPGSYSVSINNGTNEGYIHWEFGAIQGPASKLWVFDRANWDALPPTRSALRVSEREFAAHSISIWRFPDSDGQLEGHDAAFATKHGISYFVSIHGHTHDDGDFAMLLAVLARAP
jgi:hypothetical protein